jgi:hypothetical protein
MTQNRGRLAAAGIMALGLTYSAAVSGQGKTVWDGVYTEAQAKRGQALWTDKCEKCHAADLTGGEGPSLTGGEFTANWDDLSLGDLADRLRISMPQDSPQSLTREQTADLVALILQSNKMPAGQAELPAQVETLKLIKFLKARP